CKTIQCVCHRMPRFDFPTLCVQLPCVTFIYSNYTLTGVEINRARSFSSFSRMEIGELGEESSHSLCS
ncbi:MAG TPA: hypothetical protein PLQ85_05340, partial [Anaerolineae bacterium]|nr:hypothetical protein [Anaerolineae bacterium]